VAIETELEALLDEYQSWLEALPESLQSSEMATQLEETIEQLQVAVDAVSAIEPPKGFGR
jgi:hypothetical protein